MLCASRRRSPITSLFATRSLPAKSTSHNLLRVHSPVIKFWPLTITQSMLETPEPSSLLDYCTSHLQTSYMEGNNFGSSAQNSDAPTMHNTNGSHIQELIKFKEFGNEPMRTTTVFIRICWLDCPRTTSNLKYIPYLCHSLYWSFHKAWHMVASFSQLSDLESVQSTACVRRA